MSSDRIITWADIDALHTPDPTTTVLFESAGLCAHSAAKAALGLARGHYLTFEDAAITESMWALSDNGAVTDASIAKAARKLKGGATLTERRTTTQARSQLVESATAKAVGEARLSVCLITTGEGSSGHYPASTLQEAARSKVFHEGVHCYVDHPTSTEALERPGRSVRDLAGALESDATYRDGGLYATVKVYSSHRELITERAGAIGLSIRADGDLIEGTGGKPTISQITKAYSVDFVTQAGRGGRVISMTESANPAGGSPITWAEIDRAFGI